MTKLYLVFIEKSCLTSVPLRAVHHFGGGECEQGVPSHPKCQSVWSQMSAFHLCPEQGCSSLPRRAEGEGDGP